MTNSIASAKCPSILTSGKYGMSQRHSIIDDSKEYIFVKLTDSAFRAIEEYQRNAQSKRLQKGQCAKIQFVGNSGVIQFPPITDVSGTNSGHADWRKFGFAIDDVEGSLECIQQSGTELDVLGSLNYRMRIHANDDVYDTTRTKMAIAEETEKSKCIREIKPNQTDIGRKVKRPVSAASIQAYTNGTTTSSLLNGFTNGTGSSNSVSINGSSSYLSNSNNNHISSSSSNSNSRNKVTTSYNQHSPPPGGSGGGGNVNGVGGNGSRIVSNASSLRSSPNPSLIGGSGTVGGGNNRYGSPSNIPASILPTLPSNISNGGGYSPPESANNQMSGSINLHQKKSNTNSRGNGNIGGKNALGSNGKVNGISNGKTTDVSRRKIRERLIHLLALKPFKKPELYSRLQNEGLAQRERQLISTILKDISTLSRDNTYNLKRSMWNDVDENWPFFTEQELQQLKRRKPQNLTPPTNSDGGSSMSGQSPTSSTHTGSPPPSVVSSHMNGTGGAGSGIKRTSLEPDFYDGILTLGTQSKKQRISHYKKDGSSNSLINSSNIGAAGRIGLGTGPNNNSSSYNQTYRSSSAAYSPQNYNTGNNNGNDDNCGNSDLTFNVLNNMEDFIQHTAVVGGDSTYTGRNKTTTSSSKISQSLVSANSSNNNNTTSSSINNTTSEMASKEKLNSGCSSSSSVYGTNRESSAMRPKNSPTPYVNNFVSEATISSNANASTINARVNKQQQLQRLQQQQSSPNYNNNASNHYPHKSNNNSSNNSLIPNIHDGYSTSLIPSTSQTTMIDHNKISSSSRSRQVSNLSGTANGRSTGESSSNKRSKSSTPTQKNFNKIHSNKSTNLNTSNMPQQDDQKALFNDACTPPQTASQFSQQSLQQEHSSPTQQIAAAASTFSLTNHSGPSGDAPRYDFSSYTPITSIEQRRKYKTEFESDYDEYRKLLAQIESVGHRFRELADRLNRVQQGCTDYYNIKDQIVSEYNRIRKEEAINRDKLRFDYLHEKLAHIKQLVMDYDKKLTSGLASTTIATNQQHQKQESPSQQQQANVTNNSIHLSPMLQSSGESNHSPPLMTINHNTVTAVAIKNSLTSSSSHLKKNSKHNQKNHQQHEQHEHYKQHHEPETIQMVNGGQEEETSSTQYHQLSYNRYDAGEKYINRQQHITSIENSTYNDQRKHQLELQQNNPIPSQQLQNHNNNDSDSGSDSNSTSSSNDSDDDNSDASDDDNSDEDSNDYDNDDK